jgi:hypothetical protein
MDKTVRISYYPILATNIGDREFAFKGKPNLPNLVISGADTETTSYIATKLTIGDDEIAIEHEPTTNYHRRMIVRFDGISIDDLGELQLGESKEIAINSYIRKSEEPKPVFRRTANGDEIYFPTTTATTKEPVIEGACSSKKERATDDAMNKLQKQYNDLADMLNSLKGAGTVNTTYQYMDPEGDMSCQLMEDSNSEDVNVFRQALYEDKTIKDNAKSNKKLSDAATTLSIGMFSAVAFILMGILITSVFFIARSRFPDAAQSQESVYKAITWTFVGLYIIGFILLMISGTAHIAGIVILCVTFTFMTMLLIVKQPSPRDVLKPLFPASFFQ